MEEEFLWSKLFPSHKPWISFSLSSQFSSLTCPYFPNTQLLSLSFPLLQQKKKIFDLYPSPAIVLSLISLPQPNFWLSILQHIHFFNLLSTFCIHQSNDIAFSKFTNNTDIIKSSHTFLHLTRHLTSIQHSWLAALFSSFGCPYSSGSLLSFVWPSLSMSFVTLSSTDLKMCFLKGQGWICFSF